MPLIPERSRDYYADLEAVHRTLRPSTYLEIGIRQGKSLMLAGADTCCIGIDPNPKIKSPPSNAKLFKETSDEFFAQHDLSRKLAGLDLDLAFIDGMHLFEFALRDFMNIEANSQSHTVVLLHDCLPIDEATSTRERETVVWTGDVWKLIACLAKYRPDLMLSAVENKPSGLCVVTGLNRNDRTLIESYDSILEEYIPLGWAFYKEQAESLVQDRVVSLEELLRDLRRSTTWTSPAIIGKYRAMRFKQSVRSQVRRSARRRA